MQRLLPKLATLLLLAGALAASPPARSETYHTCKGFITTLPATISTQGVWCLRQDLATSINDGAAITIATNNVTLDCNDFKIGGLAAGDASKAYGISTPVNIHNVTVRNCSVRGFYVGIYVNGGGGGHRIEDNRLDNNLSHGMYIGGIDGGSVVQRNLVRDTGGAPFVSSSVGIYATGDVIDNVVDGVFNPLGSTKVTGIFVRGNGSEARGNRVRDLVLEFGSTAIGIQADSGGILLRDNHVYARVPTSGYGINSPSVTALCTGNAVVNFQTAYYGCDPLSGP